MTIWLDYSGFRPDPRELKKLGITGVSRYLSEPVPATAWKRITIAEKNAILSADLDLVLNYEWYEGRMLEGYNAGRHDGGIALTQAMALGYPEGASIYFSHDTSARNDAAVVAYLRGAQESLGSRYRTDIYSGIDVVDMAMRNGVARYGWQTLAWSGGRVGTAHMYQNGRTWFNRNADENTILHAGLGSWREAAQGGHPAPPPPHRPGPGPKPPVTHLYTIRSGDTLSAIAIHYHTTVSELVRLNPKLAANPNFIYPDEVITVPGAPGAVRTPPHVRQYRVVPGDTLSAIASRFGTSVHQIQVWNPIIKNPNLIHAGWVLRVG